MVCSMRFSPAKGVSPTGSGWGSPLLSTLCSRFFSGFAVRLLPKNRYSSAPTSGIVRMMSSHSSL